MLRASAKLSAYSATFETGRLLLAHQWASSSEKKEQPATIVSTLLRRVTRPALVFLIALVMRRIVQLALEGNCV